ncbi:uncharacterized protein V1518DRAFT_413550 [Limtongia smithiae]|uniref:uncharacterized protein n=1 Tax=Limtongia smithiae TaxID=1125753 RepID=UPI0034CEB19F
MAIHAFDYLKDYTIKDWYPIFIIVCGYILFRPYLVKIGAELQKRQHRKAGEEAKAELAKQALEPPKPDEVYVEEVRHEVWGRNARRKQKERIKEIEKAFKRKQEMEYVGESDEEIEEFLEK